MPRRRRSFVRSGKVRDLYALDDDRLLLVASDRHQRLRRRPADADPRQGPRADRAVALLVRARPARHRPQPPPGDRPGRRCPPDVVAADAAAELRGRMMICRRAEVLPVEVRRARLPRRARGWKDYRRDRRGLRHPRCRPACARATGCRSRSSRRRRRPSGRPRREHRRSTRWSSARWRRRADARRSASATSRSRLYRYGAAVVPSAAGIILADTKFEFGVDAGDGRRCSSSTRS